MLRSIACLTTMVAVSLVFHAGCGNESSNESSSEANEAPTPAPEPEKAGPPAVGADVVARSSGSGSYFEGKVKSISGNNYLVQTQSYVEPIESTVSDIYPLPTADAPNAVKVGDVVVVRSDSPQWNPAKVTSVSTGVVGVRLLEGGTTTNVTPEKVVKLNPAAAANLQQEASAGEAEAAQPEATEATAASGGGDGAEICARARRCCPAAFAAPGLPAMYANNRDQACQAVADSNDADFCRTAINGWRQMVSGLPGATMPPECTVD
jgi:hypothetical protein